MINNSLIKKGFIKFKDFLFKKNKGLKILIINKNKLTNY